MKKIMKGGLTLNMSFPDYFPEGCPPEEATDAEIELYRFCTQSPPCEEDFCSYYEQNPQRYEGVIQAYGLSVLPSADECLKALRKSPVLRAKYKYIATGANNPSRGKTLQTPGRISPRHITWWVYKDVKPHTFFVICEEGGESVE